MTMTMLDTTNWVEIPFTVDGINFKSVLDPQGGIYRQVKRIPAEMFIEMNTSAVLNLVGKDFATTLSKEEIAMRLVELNEGASEALIQIA